MFFRLFLRNMIDNTKQENDSNEKKKISKIEKGGENCERKDKRII